MPQNKEIKTLIAVSTLFIAVFLLINLIVNAEALEDWTPVLTLAMFLISFGFWAWLWVDARATTRAEGIETGAELVVPQAQEWIIPATPSAAVMPAQTQAAVEPTVYEGTPEAYEEQDEKVKQALDDVLPDSDAESVVEAPVAEQRPFETSFTDTSAEETAKKEGVAEETLDEAADTISAEGASAEAVSARVSATGADIDEESILDDESLADASLTGDSTTEATLDETQVAKESVESDTHQTKSGMTEPDTVSEDEGNVHEFAEDSVEETSVSKPPSADPILSSASRPEADIPGDGRADTSVSKDSDAETGVIEEAPAETKDAVETAAPDMLIVTEPESDAVGEIPVDGPAAEAISDEATENEVPIIQAEPAQETSIETPFSDAPVADDLTIIEGIGPYYRDVLSQAGIVTFADLAQLTVDQLRETLVNNGVSRVPRSIESWAEQAFFASNADWDGLTQFQSSLNAGRRT